MDNLNYIFVYWDQTGSNVDMFCEKVSDKIKEGYIPIGGLIPGKMVERGQWHVCQAMYKPLEPIISLEQKVINSFSNDDPWDTSDDDGKDMIKG